MKSNGISFEQYVLLECKRQWADCQQEEYGPWEAQSREEQETYFNDMFEHLWPTRYELDGVNVLNSCMGKHISNILGPGDDVYVVERDESGNPFSVSCYMFLAYSAGYVITSSFINSLQTVEETLHYHADETADNWDTDLEVFPADDCFSTRESAYEAFEEERNDV